MLPPDINYDVASFGATFLPHHARAIRRTTGPGQADEDFRELNFGGGGGGDADQDEYEFNYNQQYTREDVFGPDATTLGAPSAIALRPGDEGYLPNVARVDKRVDVKALKSTIWKELCATKKTTSASEAVPQVMKDEKPFQFVLDQLPNTLTPELVREVSVPYCFVCLLHLANEKHLSIRQESMDSLFVSQTAPSAKA